MGPKEKTSEPRTAVEKFSEYVNNGGNCCGYDNVTVDDFKDDEGAATDQPKEQG